MLTKCRHHCPWAGSAAVGLWTRRCSVPGGCIHPPVRPLRSSTQPWLSPVISGLPGFRARSSLFLLLVTHTVARTGFLPFFLTVLPPSPSPKAHHQSACAKARPRALLQTPPCPGQPSGDASMSPTAPAPSSALPPHLFSPLTSLPTTLLLLPHPLVLARACSA